MKPKMAIAVALGLAACVLIAGNGRLTGQDSRATPDKPQPIRALLICGGCCHDYAAQHKVLFEGIQARANIQVDVWWTDNNSTHPPLTVYDHVNWANNYDVIIHDECASDNKDVELLKRILKVHEKTPAVHLHCAMHSFRNGTDLWFQHVGLQSTGHGPHAPIQVEFVDKQHPIVQGLQDWTIDKDELYNNVKVFGAHALARGTQQVTRDGQPATEQAMVVWINEQHGARSFSMSIGHYTDGVSDARYLDLATRGILWACDRLSPDYQRPFAGKNVVTFVESGSDATEKSVSQPKVMPPDAKLVYVSSSSTQNPNVPANALDHDATTRWCAEDGKYPQWLQFDFQTPQSLSDIRITWEQDVAYQYRVRASSDGDHFRTVCDGSSNRQDRPRFESLGDAGQPIKSIRIEGLGTGKGGWCSIREVEFQGPHALSLWPADATFQPCFQPTPANPESRPGDPGTGG